MAQRTMHSMHQKNSNDVGSSIIYEEEKQFKSRKTVFFKADDDQSDCITQSIGNKYKITEHVSENAPVGDELVDLPHKFNAERNLQLDSPSEALDPNSILEVSKSAVFENRMAPLIAEEELSFNP